MSVKENIKDEYTIHMDDFCVKIHRLSEKPENLYKFGLKKRILKSISKIPPWLVGSAGVLTAILLFSTAVFVRFSFDTVPVLFSLLILASSFLVIPVFLSYERLKASFKKDEKIASLEWSKLPKISKLLNKKKSIEKYFKKMSNEEIEQLFNTIEMFSKLKEKEEEFINLSSLTEDKTVFKDDIEDKISMIKERNLPIIQYLNNFEQKIISESVDEEFISVMSSLNEFMAKTEDKNILMEEELTVEKSQESKLYR